MEEPTRPGILQVLIRCYRALRGWDQAELAANAHLDASSVCRYEGGATTPPPKTQERLAASVDLTMPFVDLCLRPVLEAARVASAPLGDELSADLEEAGAELDRALAGTGRSAIGLLVQTLEEEDREPWERTDPPSEADRPAAAAAWERLEPRSHRERLMLVETFPEFQTWALAERLCHQSVEAASGTATAALDLAQVAGRAAELSRCEEPFRSRLRGYALAYLANARRVKTDLQEADADFARALKLWQAGAASSSAGLLAEWRLLDLEASLRRGQRRFAVALRLHDRAQAAAPSELSGRVLLNRAATLHQMGRTEAAITTLRAAAPLVEGQHEPDLLFALRFNLASCLCDLGLYPEAEALLPEARDLAMELRKDLHLVRVLWLSGKVAAGLGRKEEARLAFEQVRRDFTDREMAYDCALVSLELAALHLEEGRTAEVRALAAEMLWIFKAQGIEREALSAVRLFCDAAKKETATAEQARRVCDFLHRALREPGLRFEG